jgi:hypothetical protein
MANQEHQEQGGRHTYHVIEANDGRDSEGERLAHGLDDDLSFTRSRGSFMRGRDPVL